MPVLLKRGANDLRILRTLFSELKLGAIEIMNLLKSA
jgi:hypothetical protein